MANKFPLFFAGLLGGEACDSLPPYSCSPTIAELCKITDKLQLNNNYLINNFAIIRRRRWGIY